MDGNGSLQARWAGFAVAAVVGLAGCSPTAMMDTVLRREPVPPEPGLYVQLDGVAGTPSWQRLDGTQQWEVETWSRRSDFAPQVVFVIRHPDLAVPARPLEEVVHLRRVAWVRSAINERGEIMPADGGRWGPTDLDIFSVPLNVQRIRDDAIRVVPTTALTPGLYSLEFDAAGGPQRARLGVQWSSVDQRAYSSDTCVDRYDGAGPRYRPCAEQTQTTQLTGLEWLRLYLVAPELRQVAQGQALLVQGVIVNTSTDERATVPRLEAQVRGTGGEVLQRWLFDPGIAALEPGQSASFRTEAQQMPAGAHSVHVEFAPR